MYDAATLKYSGVVNKETGERVYQMLKGARKSKDTDTSLSR
jgi:nicotinamide mononucleotide (NMN) deamidase PncC